MASCAEFVELRKPVSELTLLRGERNSWHVERDNSVQQAEVADVAERERSVDFRDAQETFSSMVAMLRQNQDLER